MGIAVGPDFKRIRTSPEATSDNVRERDMAYSQGQGI